MKEFSYEELSTSTNNFSVDHLIGKGSHGNVYKATLKLNRQLQVIAIKKPLSNNYKLDNEIAILSSLHDSPNIVNLIAISHDHNLLVTDFMPNGSLHDLLHCSQKPPLPFSRRLLIILQIANALLYLHDSGVVHRDVKSENILLDARNNAKLADFSLAVRVHEDHVPAAGTFGYLDPEYTEANKLSTKNDVFSFGVVVLEIVSGRRVVDVEREPASIVEWVREMVREGLVGEVGGRGAGGWVVGVAMRCVERREERRPTMREVVGELRSWLSWRGLFRRAWTRWGKRKKMMMMVTRTTKIVCKDHLVEEEDQEEI